ncbi:MAG: hypothetical protein ACE5F6_00265 [Anaerolineae bacterium]
MNPTRLMYSKANQAFVFTFGDQLLRIGDDNPMFYRRKSEAIRAALRQGFLVNEKTGFVTSVEGRRPPGGLGRQPRGSGLSALEGRATLRTPVGTRVRFVPNPASFQLYTRPPARGEEGEVTTTMFPGGRRRSAMPGPGGGLLYVRWDRVGVQGVSPVDVEIVYRPRRGATGVSALEGVSKADKLRNLDDLTRGYIRAALWSTNDESDESGGLPLDENYGPEDLTVEALDKMIQDCEKFQQDNAELLAQAGDPARNGHDFWLTRNGHGTEFWDREEYPEAVGEGLSDAARRYGEVDLYVSRGKIYQS